MAEAITARLPRQTGWLVVAVVAGLSLIVAPGALLLAALLVCLIGRGALHRLGGASGDVYGAAIELIETAVLLAMALPSGT
jgi:adenosylcobinamide-GDP ribazoletransferase